MEGLSAHVLAAVQSFPKSAALSASSQSHKGGWKDFKMSTLLQKKKEKKKKKAYYGFWSLRGRQ